MDTVKYSIYLAEYLIIEEELLDLTKSIFFGDSNLKVYSLRIADLIIKICTEMESVAKDLYRDNNQTDPKNSSMAFNWLNANWNIKYKKVRIRSSFIDFRNNLSGYYAPFNYKDKSPDNYYSVYCSLKHDKVKNLNKANINALMRSCGALYILLCYVSGGTSHSELFEPLISNTSVGFLMDFGVKDRMLTLFLRDSVLIDYYDLDYLGWKDKNYTKIRNFTKGFDSRTNKKIIKSCLSSNDNGSIALYKIILLSSDGKTMGEIFDLWKQFDYDNKLASLNIKRATNKGYNRIYLSTEEWKLPSGKITNNDRVCELDNWL